VSADPEEPLAIPSWSAPQDADEARLVSALRAGDEEAFAALVDRHTGAMLRVARLHVASREMAEDVVQETWVSVLRSLDRFEARSSLRTWIFVILGHCALKHAARERRSVPLANLGSDDTEAAVPSERFYPSPHPRWAGMWSTLVDGWERVPDEALIGGEGRRMFEAALHELPVRYATVFVLRDIQGWPSDEVSSLLGISVGNQRVLLHRARTRIRSALESYFGQEDA
jgi:RNA polymerase sigma-70 factor (ECF subfamily)